MASPKYIVALLSHNLINHHHSLPCAHPSHPIRNSKSLVTVVPENAATQTPPYLSPFSLTSPSSHSILVVPFPIPITFNVQPEKSNYASDNRSLVFTPLPSSSLKNPSIASPQSCLRKKTPAASVPDLQVLGPFHRSSGSSKPPYRQYKGHTTLEPRIPALNDLKTANVASRKKKCSTVQGLANWKTKNRAESLTSFTILWSNFSAIESPNYDCSDPDTVERRKVMEKSQFAGIKMRVHTGMDGVAVF
ncbi:hypothetical protein BJ165DRAFT_1405532 [Panaeolus papilionaceus]|nr:hypothetical protein BJ165DRAFT_1405532 [Panaeolus papilionaceus]